MAWNVSKIKIAFVIPFCGVMEKARYFLNKSMNKLPFDEAYEYIIQLTSIMLWKWVSYVQCGYLESWNWIKERGKSSGMSDDCLLFKST